MIFIDIANWTLAEELTESIFEWFERKLNFFRIGSSINIENITILRDISFTSKFATTFLYQITHTILSHSYS